MKDAKMISNSTWVSTPENPKNNPLKKKNEQAQIPRSKNSTNSQSKAVYAKLKHVVISMEEKTKPVVGDSKAD